MVGKRRCIVPNCQFYHRRNNKEDRLFALFKCPSNPTQARRWANSVPGLRGVIERQDHVCEKHFDPTYITKKIDYSTGLVRTRLASSAVPTIFAGVNNLGPPNVTTDYHDLSAAQLDGSFSITQLDHNASRTQFNYSSSTSQSNRSSTPCNNNNINRFKVSKIVLKKALSEPKKDENLVNNVVKDLLASEPLLVSIKQEEFPPEEVPRIKVESSEDFNGKIKLEEEKEEELKKLTVYEYVKYNQNYLTTLLPESWSISQFSVNDEVFAFSKECTINENGSWLVMYEKNIVIDKGGNVHYSIHGKKLEIDDPTIPKIITNTKLLLKVILQFNELKVCEGILTSEFEVDKDCILYKDDLGNWRHVNCYLITDKQQCDNCYSYNQYLSSTMVHRPVLTDRQYFYNQMYVGNSSR